MKFVYKVKYWKKKAREQLIFLKHPTLKKINNKINQEMRANQVISARKTLAPDMEDKEFTYGESLYWTLYKLGRELGISKKDKIVDLGCGPGKVVFFYNTVFGATAIGVELYDKMVAIAKQIKNEYHLQDVDFYRKDIRDYEPASSNIVYLCCTCFTRETMETLQNKFKEKKGLRLICVSQSLPGIPIKKTYTLPFSWGDTSVYVHSI